MSGKTANDIASAVIKIIHRIVVDFPKIKNITTWSDSCVPQNRNSVMVFAVGKFIEDAKKIDTITMNYSTPGHSAVQVVDSVYSKIETEILRNNEIYSPLSLIRI